ncbi:MAG: hypothetical protein BroJett033_7420 [Chloroflexota bacterium]|nr:MAG: hypothetical protein BroJett033_7420 [Chloroflexota bacterium]
MTTNTAADRARDFKDQVEGKIQALLKEFADGKLNREQFNALYERYSGQLAVAQQAAASDSPAAFAEAHGGGQTTIAIKQEHMGKALGLVIYQNRTGVSVETLGDFDVSAFVISPVLNDFTRMMEAQRLIEHRTIQLDDRRWLLFAGGRYTTVVTLFRNEPSPAQVREIMRLHNDFEIANAPLLERGGQPDGRKLAYPFIVFVQQKLKRA